MTGALLVGSEAGQLRVGAVANVASVWLLAFRKDRNNGSYVQGIGKYENGDSTEVLPEKNDRENLPSLISFTMCNPAFTILHSYEF